MLKPLEYVIELGANPLLVGLVVTLVGFVASSFLLSILNAKFATNLDRRSALVGGSAVVFATVLVLGSLKFVENYHDEKEKALDDAKAAAFLKAVRERKEAFERGD